MIAKSALQAMTLLGVAMLVYVGYLFITDPLAAFLQTGHSPDALESVMGMRYWAFAFIVTALMILQEFRSLAVVFFTGFLLALVDGLVIWRIDGDVAPHMIAALACIIIAFAWVSAAGMQHREQYRQHSHGR